MKRRSTSSSPQTIGAVTLSSTSRRRYRSKFVTGLRFGFQTSAGAASRSSWSAKHSASVSSSFSTDSSESALRFWKSVSTTLAPARRACCSPRASSEVLPTCRAPLTSTMLSCRAIAARNFSSVGRTM